MAIHPSLSLTNIVVQCTGTFIFPTKMYFLGIRIDQHEAVSNYEMERK